MTTTPAETPSATCELADDECFGEVTTGPDGTRCFRHTEEGLHYGQITQREIDEAGRFQL